MSWSRVYPDPITVDGREPVTLRHAAEYVQELPAAAHKRPEWQSAVRILIAAAGGRSSWRARIAMMRAIDQRVIGRASARDC